MAPSFIFMLILFSVTASKGEAREKRKLHPDDEEMIDRIQNQLYDLKTSLRNRDCMRNGSNTIWTKTIGAVYTRWGRSDCRKGSELVYAGRAAGSHFREGGNGANTLCLPMDPEWGYKVDGHQYASSYIYGAEFETSFKNSPYKNHNNNNVPCAVCRTLGRPYVYMMPARRTCYKGWTVEYTGYLMSAYPAHTKSEYLCMDKPIKAEHSPKNQDGKLFYAVEAKCGSLPCPPYIPEAELTCVVCSM